MQPSGIQTEQAGGRLGNESVLAHWLLNNHWDVNFASAQVGGIPARFRLLPQYTFDAKAARQFSEDAYTPPVIVRAYDSTPIAPASLLICQS